MEEKRYCACGCGGEVRVWKNNRTSSFLRGHHMRNREYQIPPSEKHYCKCGCGREINPLPSGHIRDYIWNHHTKGVVFTMEKRIKRVKDRWRRDPIFSPYIPDTFISCKGKKGKDKRWFACVRENNKSTSVLHARAVYEHYFGDIPEGYVVHHKDGKHSEITDDRPENLMPLPDEWNLRFFPVLAKGFGIPEETVTETYLSIFDKTLTKEALFAKLCSALIEITGNATEGIPFLLEAV